MHLNKFLRSRLALTFLTTRCHTTKEGVSAGLAAEAKVLPRWMVNELRTNHAGEYGAVRIYQGALAGLRLHHAVLPGRGPGRGADGPSSAALLFLREHEENERVHLHIMEELTRVTGSRTRLIPVWHMAGYATGFLPALLGGQRAIYHTVSSVETFVEEHYQDQISRLRREGALPLLQACLESCCEDEVEHRREAETALLDLHNRDHDGHREGHRDRAAVKAVVSQSGVVKAWSWLVDCGSRGAVKLSRVV
jgi:ubiquinone biosynthesis monooxygenase Coq7